MLLGVSCKARPFNKSSVCWTVAILIQVFDEDGMDLIHASQIDVWNTFLPVFLLINVYNKFTAFYSNPRWIQKMYFLHLQFFLFQFSSAVDCADDAKSSDSCSSSGKAWWSGRNIYRIYRKVKYSNLVWQSGIHIYGALALWTL